jgi:apolipoprotein N-acyltransferase
MCRAPGLDFNAERRQVLDNHVSVTISGVGATCGRAPTDTRGGGERLRHRSDPQSDAAAVIQQAVEAAGTDLLGGLAEARAVCVQRVVSL